MNGDSLLSNEEEDPAGYKQWVLAARNVLKTDIDYLQMIPTAALKMLALTQDENTSSLDLAEIIQTEPALAAKILQMVNSAAFSLPNNIQSIHHALSMIGFSEIRQIAMEQLLFSQLFTQGNHHRFEQLFFWQHCLFVACLSKQLAIDLGHPNPDALYTAGLLHDIGKLVFENHGKASYSDFLASSGKNDCPADQNERVFFGLTHAEIGHVFCVKWNLPAVITAAVSFHHGLAPPYSKYAEHNDESAIISFANYLAWLHGIGSSKGEVGQGLAEGVINLINFSRLDFENLLRRVDQAMAHTSQFYGITFPDIQKLRASLVFTVIKIGRDTHLKAGNASQRLNFFSSLISPHCSLDPKEIILSTLKATHDDFGFERVMMFGMSPNRRGLLARQCWPKDESDLVIPMEALGGQLLECLRSRTPVIINKSGDMFSQRLTAILNTECFIAVPVLRNNRLIGLLYADYPQSGKTIDPECLARILPIANELGLALLHAKKFEMAKKQAEIDSLTQLYNKGKINCLLSDVYRQEAEEREKLAIGFVDIDHFKKFNDICGHQAGDDALRIVAAILRSLSRPADFVGRYGGEEFLFALRHTDRDGAYGYAERMRLEVEKRGKILSGRFKDLSLTVSIGIALYNPTFQSYREQIVAADQAMYQAKHQGRNRVWLMD